VLDADVACLEQLAQQVQKLARKYGLDAVKTNNLQLVCEELFVYLADAPGGTERSIRFRFEQADQTVLVEVDDKGDFGDVDDVNGELQSTDQLGLFLLNRVARKVEHLRFGEYHAIHCEIE
jgi:anti-sigma regulatory factor (Ser/Thr protein kinase)